MRAPTPEPITVPGRWAASDRLRWRYRHSFRAAWHGWGDAEQYPMDAEERAAHLEGRADGWAARRRAEAS